jgi:hypothetical protein
MITTIGIGVILITIDIALITHIILITHTITE